MKILLAFFFIFTMAAILGSNEPDFATFGTCFAMLALLVIGMLYAWSRNGGNEGRSFLERYLAIGWVVNFRVSIIIQALLLLSRTALALTGQIDPEDEDSGKSLAMFFMIIGEIYIAWNIGHHVGEVRQSAEARLAPAPAVSPDQSIERLDKMVESIVHREVGAAVRGVRPRRKIITRSRKVSRRK